jgi:hypothetical protein
MLKLVVNLYVVLFLCSCLGHNYGDKAKIAFIQKKHCFGNIKHKEIAQFKFDFINPGKEELVILDVESSCGCAKPEWDDDPISQGERSTIKVEYDAEAPGVFVKSFKVFYNGKNSPAILRIRGTVVKDKK